VLAIIEQHNLFGSHRLPDDVYFKSGQSKKKTTPAVAKKKKKKKTKKDVHHEMMITAMDHGANVDQDQLQAELARSRIIQNASQVDSLAKLNRKNVPLAIARKRPRHGWGQQQEAPQGIPTPSQSPCSGKEGTLWPNGFIDTRELCI
jgi:hypothetical protein